MNYVTFNIIYMRVNNFNNNHRQQVTYVIYLQIVYGIFYFF